MFQRPDSPEEAGSIRPFKLSEVPTDESKVALIHPGPWRYFHQHPVEALHDLLNRLGILCCSVRAGHLIWSEMGGVLQRRQLSDPMSSDLTKCWWGANDPAGWYKAIGGCTTEKDTQLLWPNFRSIFSCIVMATVQYSNVTSGPQRVPRSWKALSL